MLPSEIVSEVLQITKRPDKEATVYRELNKAIRKLSTSTELARDLWEEVYPLVDTHLLVHEIPLSDLSKTFRKFCYILPVGYRQPLKLITPDALFDVNCREALDSYYVSNTSFRVNLSRPQPALKLGYFEFPMPIVKGAPLTDGYPWLCDVAEYVLIDLVAAAVFRNIGDDASAQAHEADARLSWESLKQDIHWGGLPQ